MKTQVRVGSSGEGDKALVTRRRRLNACDGMKRRGAFGSLCNRESQHLAGGGKRREKVCVLKIGAIATKL